MKKNETRQVRCGDVLIGGGAPVSIQSMTNVDSRDEHALTEQIARLADAGCQIVRISVPDAEAAEVFGSVKRKFQRLPLVADIHFDYRMAIEAIRQGADKIRINPGNIGGPERVREVVQAAKEREIPIRVGVNSGSLEKPILTKYGGVTAAALAESALYNLAMIEDLGYDRLVVSLKASDVTLNYEAHKLLAAQTDVPVHIGITEAGTPKRGKLKSAIGIGSLLLCGIGDTMRVSLTADPVEEVLFAKEILRTLGMRTSSIDLVSCPTCGRTKINLEALANEVEAKLAPLEDALLAKGYPSIKVAVMGCAVNGPGEAREADFGVAGGDGQGLLFANGEIVRSAVPEDKLAEELLALIRKRIFAQ
ncbi:MAG: flavodoxin-dependent (E)-4-hydroxy-3-methylbut-2-enyl-diphosphate synthase [Clostridia bacterium]